MLTVVILSLFVISATVFSGYVVRKSIQERVSSVTDFVVDVEEDLPRMLFVFGFRAVFLTEQEIVAGDVENFSALFEEAFFNGSFNGVDKDIILNGAKYEDIVDKLNQRGEKIGVRMNFTNPSIKVNQSDPWNLRVEFNANFTASDLGGLVSWNKSMSIVEYISISNFTDPLYVKNTNGEYNRRIVQTPYNFTNGVSDLSAHLSGSYYVANVNSPSFIDRLEGNFLVSSPNGIESLVNIDDLNDLPSWYDRGEKSMIDYQYFSSINPGYCEVSGMPASQSWFRIDSSRVGDYGVLCA